LSPKNPFLRKSTLPFQLPPFAQIKESDFAPAFNEGMRLQRLEIDAISNNKESPTFQNTVIPYEQSGAILSRVSKVFFNLTISNTQQKSI
jgi:peptidyl-dipeptidase Dcp